MEALSEKDQKLIALLRQNARRPASEIAGLLDVSRQTVQKRIERLVEKDVIKRFTVETAEGSDALPQGAGLIAFTLNLRQNACGRLFGVIRHWPELKHCWSLAGDKDMMAVFEVVATTDTETLRHKLSRHPDVLSLTTSPILKTWR